MDFSLIKDLLIKIYLFFIIYFIFKKYQSIRIGIGLFNLQNSQANETRQEIPKFFLSLQGSQAWTALLSLSTCFAYFLTYKVLKRGSRYRENDCCFAYFLTYKVLKLSEYHTRTCGCFAYFLTYKVLKRRSETSACYVCFAYFLTYKVLKHPGISEGEINVLHTS